MASLTSQDEHRLPTNVKARKYRLCCLFLGAKLAQPLHYDLAVHTDLEKLKFTGVVSVDLEVNDDTSKIVLNSLDLDIAPAKLVSDALQGEIATSTASIDKDKGRATFEFAKTLPKGSKARLTLPFVGKLTDSMIGYYISAYEQDGKKKYCALTQFEPVEARRAFPCWDEPLLKATFAITLVSHPDTVNLSNMQALSERVLPAAEVNASAEDSDILSPLQLDAGSYKVTKFATTPPMSTYLAAYANGDYKHLESSYTSPLSGKTRPLRIYSTPDVTHLTQFALDVKARALPIYEEIFKIEYPLPKLDTLIVAQFDAGAMENWGLITARQVIYMYDPEKSDILAKKRVVVTQSHECAHMWFGNIVTMSWWDNLWLNEGFASLMGEVIVMDKLYPEWKANSEFIDVHLSRALSLDAKRSSHPIEVPIHDAETINQLFDALSYSKAASMLRMLVAYVGEEKFLEGVTLYLKKRLYGNSVTRDLWEAIQEATGFDVPTLMNEWTLKIGYPVLTVKETDGGIVVRQDRFLDTGDAKDSENETIWQVPLQLLSTDASGKATVDSSLVLREREAKFAVDTTKPYKLNSNTNGVYRVSYTPERWLKIAEEAARPNSVFTLEDRMGLVSDAFELAQAGYTKTSSALDLAAGLENESEYLVWTSISSSLGSLINVWWEQKPEYDQLKAFRTRLFLPVVQRLGFEQKAGEDVDDTQLRSLAIATCASSGEKSVIEHLQGLWRKYLETNDESSIPADLVRTTLISAVRDGGDEDYKAAKDIYLKPVVTPTFRLAAISALCSTRNEALAQQTFDFLRNQVSNQDWHYFYGVLASNPVTRRLLTAFTKKHYEEIRSKFEGTALWSNLIKYSFSNLTKDEDIVDAQKFFEGKDVSKYNLALQQALDGIRTSSAWLKRSNEDVAAWLARNSSS
ncbi:hypothetical protein EXIGLDRAFT_779983 [Exidia glandulosa HHB12029]|uniref:Aminopeptidase n=1 Tax=Exidia glandulosa HHB12029 TaxID=1314781 RepID=A0A165BT88_EXIGL|nr:hypothetical protein EXIGLDRAFT_779983 [Exidia glandulosa HHB12029]